MAYTYNPYPMQPQLFQSPQQIAQSISGLSFIDDLSVLDTLKMPPGSVSQPYFLKNEDKFAIVTFDNVGGSTMELFSFKKEPLPQAGGQSEFVTKEYFDQQMRDMMEAINGKYAIREDAAENEPAAHTAADPATAV